MWFSKLKNVQKNKIVQYNYGNEHIVQYIYQNMVRINNKKQLPVTITVEYNYMSPIRPNKLLIHA